MRMATVRQSWRDHPSLGFVAPAATRAEAKQRLSWTAWESGAFSAAHTLQHVRPVVQVAAAGGIGAVLGLALPHLWVWRLLLGAAVAVVVYFAVPLLWTAVAALLAPVRQRNEARHTLTEYKRRAELSIELRAAADLLAGEYIGFKESHFAVPRTPAHVTERVKWFVNLADGLAETMAARGLADRSEQYRLREDADGRPLPPLCLAGGPNPQQRPIESVGDLLNALVTYRDRLTELARELVRDCYARSG